MTYLEWGSACFATLLWLASVATLIVVAFQSAHPAQDMLGWTTQLLLTALATPVLWLWWRHLLGQHRAARPPEPLQRVEEPHPHLSLGGEISPPQRW